VAKKKKKTQKTRGGGVITINVYKGNPEGKRSFILICLALSKGRGKKAEAELGKKGKRINLRTGRKREKRRDLPPLLVVQGEGKKIDTR